MTTSTRRKPKAEGGRTEVFAIRLDPKLKYLAELAARKQRRSLANFVEWALDVAMRETVIDDKKGKKVWDEAELLWDISEHGRFLRLVERHPELLSYEEQQILYTIRNHQVSDPNSGMTLRFTGDKGELFKRAITACWKEIVRFSLDRSQENEFALSAKMVEIMSPNQDI
jgi:hypothetical protein